MVDASVAIKRIVPEEHNVAAENLLLSQTGWVAPEFLLVEGGNVLRSKFARQQLDDYQARSGLEFVRAVVDRLVPDRELIERALELAIDLNHSVYDCIYLACAERFDMRLVTADRKLLTKLERTSFQGRAQALVS